MHWTCPTCELQWLDTGAGFPGQRFSSCLRCGADACEPDDARPAWHRQGTLAPGDPGVGRGAAPLRFRRFGHWPSWTRQRSGTAHRAAGAVGLATVAGGYSERW